MATELKACPNPDCGGVPMAKAGQTLGGYIQGHVYCTHCEMRGPLTAAYTNKDSAWETAERVAAELWNALPRPTPPPIGTLREAVARIVDPSAWKLDRDGYLVEQVHSDEALAKADQILSLLPTQPLDREGVGRHAAVLRELKSRTPMYDGPDTPKGAHYGAIHAALDATILALSATPSQGRFQERVQPWMLACFGPEISADAIERNHRFLEEALELVQACGCSADEAHQLVDYVYGRPAGERSQEVGGVMVTLAALCLAQGLDMHAAGETELARIWTKVEQIRAKQAAKPKHSPLPQAATPSPSPRERRLEEALRRAQTWFERANAPDDEGTDFLNEGGWDEAPTLLDQLRAALSDPPATAPASEGDAT